MDKIDLDWFLKRGYKLAEGDVIFKVCRIKLHVNDAYILNERNNTDGEINSFEWRNEQGAKPKCLNDDTEVLITFKALTSGGSDSSSRVLACDVHWSQSPLWKYDYNALLEQQYNDNKMASTGVAVGISAIADDARFVVGEGVDKNKMIELVKNAPEGAVHWAPDDNGMHEAYFNDDLSKAFVQGHWYDVIEEGAKEGAIKLEYSVNEEKPKMRSLSDKFERLFWEYDSELPNADNKRMLFKKYLAKANLLIDDSVPDEKPVYTKAMCDAGELPPVGCECVIAESTEYMTVSYKSGTVVKIYARFVDDRGAHLAAFVDANGQVGGVGVWQCFKPIKTDQEKLIDELARELETTMRGTEHDAWIEDAEYLLSKFNITKKA